MELQHKNLITTTATAATTIVVVMRSAEMSEMNTRRVLAVVI